MAFYCRGIRGATTVEENTAPSILAATRELLEWMVALNDLRVEDIASVIFSATPDLNAAYPARAARQMGWHDTALFCCQEIPVPDGLPRCIRVLIHWNSTKRPEEIEHVYLKRAATLRPDRADASDIDTHEEGHKGGRGK
jgi:chorismate mutase